MARTREGAQVTELYRRQQVALRAQIIKEVTRLFPLWRPKDPASWPAFEDAMVRLVQRGASLSSAISGAYYEVFRAAETGTRAAAVLASPPSEAQIRAAVSATARSGVFNAFGGGKSYLEAMNNGLVRASGSASRLVLDAGRDTIVRSVRSDARTYGWQRVTGASPCEFCSMLADRGAVYKASTVDFEAHDHCSCSAEPVYR